MYNKPKYKRAQILATNLNFAVGMNFEGMKWESLQYSGVFLHNGKTSFKHDFSNIKLNIMDSYTHNLANTAGNIKLGKVVSRYTKNMEKESLRIAGES